MNDLLFECFGEKGVKRVKNEQIVQRRKSGSPSDAVILKSPSGQFLIPN